MILIYELTDADKVPTAPAVRNLAHQIGLVSRSTKEDNVARIVNKALARKWISVRVSSSLTSRAWPKDVEPDEDIRVTKILGSGDDSGGGSGSSSEGE